jgi:hypothetical protein
VVAPAANANNSTVYAEGASYPSIGVVPVAYSAPRRPQTKFWNIMSEESANGKLDWICTDKSLAPYRECRGWKPSHNG